MKKIDFNRLTSMYHWTFVNLGGSTRVKIQSAEDLRHLSELDPKKWTVLSCPVSGLEVSEQTLSLMDTNKDGQLHLDEVIASTKWLCDVLVDPSSLFKGEDSVEVANIKDEALVAVAKKIAGDKTVIGLADVQTAIDAVTIDPVTPTLTEEKTPFDADVIAAYKEKQAEYATYFQLEKMAKLGLAVIPEDVVKPGLTEDKFNEMGAQIAAYEAIVAANAAATAEADAANAAALAAAKAEFEPLFKLLILSRDYYLIIRNYVAFEDFYNGKKAIFQAGRLVIDQRICHLCLRVSDMGKQDAQAAASGMFLVYCNCTNKVLGKTMTIVAAMTQGEIRNLTVGKNAIFYDRQGNDWDATVTKIVDNPISIKQAFWSPYRKFAKWIQDLVNKSAAEKNDKALTNLQSTAQAKIADPAAAPADKKTPFDIAKFAGIFAAIGMAIGFIGSFLTSLAGGIEKLAVPNVWPLLVAIAALMLVISGPAMFMAWLKLRKRNLAPILNANGWAINADAIVNVPFGATLTEMVQFPLIKLPKKGLATWKKVVISIAVILVVLIVAWLIAHYCFGYTCCCLPCC